MRHEDLPSSCDPIWVEWAQPVLCTLKTPQTMSQLKEWARSARVEIGRLINTLSWLDLQGLVKTDRSNGIAVWHLVPAQAPIVKAPFPKLCTRCDGRMKAEPERAVCVKCGHSLYPPVEFEDRVTD
jgi:hypothetical protein